MDQSPSLCADDDFFNHCVSRLVLMEEVLLLGMKDREGDLVSALGADHVRLHIVLE